MDSACSGFLFGMSTAARYIESGRYNKVLLIGADKMSSIINYKDRASCIIFGDGAGAVLFEPNDEGLGVQDEYLRTDGSGREFLQATYGGSSNAITHEVLDRGGHYLFQEGKTVFKNAVFNMADATTIIMERNQLNKTDVQWLAAHQANKRIINATAERMELNPEKVMMNIEKYGNTTSATLPLLLNDYETQLKKGDTVIFAAFGYNESFAGSEGLPAFKARFNAFLSQIKSRAYNGTSGARIIVLSPIANEDVPGVAAGERNNENRKPDKVVDGSENKNRIDIKLRPKNKLRRLSFKEAKELKELDIKLPLLEEQKINLEKEITGSNGDITEISHQLAAIIESIQEYEDRWIELSELSE